MKQINRIVLIVLVGMAALAWGDDPVALPAPYNPEGWPAQHHDAHNSDYIPIPFPAFDPAGVLSNRVWWLRDTNNPVVCVGGGTIARWGSNEFFVVTTGKIKTPNLYVFSMDDGSLYWHSSSPTQAINPGPESCALTIAPTVDRYGRIYLADCHHVYCYPLERALDSDGNQPFLWRRVMPNLKVYHEEDQLWVPTSDPETGDTKSNPFMSFVLSPEVDGQFYVGGTTVQGEFFFFNPTNGELFAEAFLETNVLGVVSNDSPCDPQFFAEHNVPLSPLLSNPITFGIWATGSNTDDPDLDYFMNPCQLKAYLAAGTFGTGSMIANNPCMARDPTNAAKCRLYIAGRQSSESARFDSDADTNTQDAVMYRVDFDPTQPPSNRLLILNYAYTNPALGQALFDGRMDSGENTATSPDLSFNEKWLFAGDKLGFMHCFSAEDGSILWSFPAGEMLGSPTTVQIPDTNGWFRFYTFGDYDPWVFDIDAESGQIVSNVTDGQHARHLPLGSLITNAYWRTEPAFQTNFYTVAGESNLWNRRAIGASVIVGASNLIQMIYTVGWQRPNDPTEGLWVVPTHQVVLVLPTEALLTYTNLTETIQGAYLDTNGTSEVGLIFSPSARPNGVLFYGIQSCCVAQFLDVNHMMPDGMETLYMRPYGGVGLFRIPQFSFFPDVESLWMQNNQLVLSWVRTSTAGQFRVEQSSGLLHPSWSPVEPTNQWPIHATCWTGTYPATESYYRVQQIP